MTDHYEYKGLGEKAKEAAVATLKEDPAKVNDHIESFRNTVKSKPHLTCPHDSNFLLKFLRIAKFEHKKAEELIDNFCTLKSCCKKGAPEYFHHVKLDDPMLKEYLEKELVIPLGRSEAGNFVILTRTHLWDPDTIPLHVALNLLFMSLDILVHEEETQIYGVEFIYDLTDVPRKVMCLLSDAKLLSNINKILHDGYPLKLQSEIFYNEPELFDIVYQMYTFFKRDEEKCRVCRVKGNIEHLKEKIPEVEKLLPTEYGGQAGPLGSIAEKWNSKFREFYKNGDPRPSVCTDESKRPEEAKGHLPEHAEYTGPKLEKE